MKHLRYSDYTLLVAANKVLLQRIFYSGVIISFLLSYRFNILVSQVGENPLADQDADPVYLLFMITGIADFFKGWFAAFIEMLMMFCSIGAIVYPAKRLFPVSFLVMYFPYFITYNMVAGHHYTNTGLLIMALPFVFGGSRFISAFTFCRFIFCFMMFTAACWKIARGNLWHIDQTGMLLVNTSLHSLAAGVTDWHTELVRWLINHKPIAHMLWVILIVLELLFAAGFVTLKWDKYLLIGYGLFFIGGWFLFNIYNFENLFFLNTLTPVLLLADGVRKLLPAANPGNKSL